MAAARCLRGFLTNHAVKTRFCTRLAAQLQPRMLCSSQTEVGEQKLCQGINYLKEGSDPPLLADSEYPEWLWGALRPKQPVDEDSADVNNKAYWRRKNKIQRRKENAVKKGKKF